MEDLQLETSKGSQQPLQSLAHVSPKWKYSVYIIYYSKLLYTIF